jgi:Mg2+/Co2+ transporter CorB
LSEIPLSVLFAILVFLILVSAFFSGSETALMSLNRYKLKHLANQKHKAAMRASRLLKHPDRFIGLILLGNNLVNVLLIQIASYVIYRVWGEYGAAASPVIITIVLLVFAELTPKTLAALHPERYAFPASFFLTPLQWLFQPFVFFINKTARLFLRILRVPVDMADQTSLGHEELRTVVVESGSMISQRHQSMLLNILDLGTVTIDDIMVPRGEIVGIDIDDDWNTIIEQLYSGQHTRIPIFKNDIDHVIGMIHARNILKLITDENFTLETLTQNMREPYFMPEGTPLNKALVNFQQNKRRIAMVVDEYGELEGLVTLEDILEEIVGEFTSDPAASSKEIHPQEDGSFLIDGSINLRELNRIMQWELPTDGPKTLNGLILEHLENIPETGTSLRLAGYPLDIIQISNNSVKTVRVYPEMRTPEAEDSTE